MSDTPASASELLAHSRWLIRNRTPDTRGRWPRAAAVLARQALELQVDRICGERDPALAQCSERAQLLCLPSLMDHRQAKEIAFVWSALSRSVHHHPYEMPPTAEELEGWIDVVESLEINKPA